MLSTPEKTVILAGTLCSSVFLFATGLGCLNAISLQRNHINVDQNIINKLIVINGVTMLFSAATFGYISYKAIK